MIKFEHTDVHGFEPAIRGMRNPMNSWERSDSLFNFEGFYESDGDRDCGCESIYGVDIMGEPSESWSVFDDGVPFEGEENWSVGTGMLLGPNDRDLMMRLAKAGTEHSKYRRFLNVYVDITAPLYWWKEFDTYKVGTAANSCSTMHKIHAKEFTLEDFSCEHLMHIENPVREKHDVPTTEVFGFIYDPDDVFGGALVQTPMAAFESTIRMLNRCRDRFLETKDKRYWWNMIQLLPTSYNQKRTVLLNYENLAAMYRQRKDHKLDEWRDFCSWIETLPYSYLITLRED